MKNIFITILALGLVACSSNVEHKGSTPNRDIASMSMSHKELFEIIDEQNYLFENYKGEITDKLQFAQMNTKYKKLLSRWENYISQHPNDTEALIIYGKFLRAVGEFSDAYRVFLSIDKVNPDIAVVKQQLATSQGDFGMYKEALANLRQAIALDDTQSVYFYQIAELLSAYYDEFILNNIYDETYLNSEIDANFKKAIELSLENTHLWWRYAQSFYEQKNANWENALKAWETLAKYAYINMDKNNVQLNKARVLIELYRDDEAMQILGKIDTPALQKNKDRLISIIKAQKAGDEKSVETLKEEDAKSTKAQKEIEASNIE